VLLFLVLAFPLVTLIGGQAMLRGAEPAVSAFDGAPPQVADEEPPMLAGHDADGDGLDDALEAALARRHAPRYLFAAYDPDGPDCPQNWEERAFPMSVARFLAGLEAGVYQVHGRGAVRAQQPGHFGEERVTGYSSGMSGDPPGQAPVYTHVYPGAPGEAFVEYWVFYAHDFAEAEVLGLRTSWGDHRGDWEHSAYRVSLDPPRVLEGFYYGHAKCLVVSRDDLELTLDADGHEHPAVYVSQGKHASYPVACWIATLAAPQWLIGHHDFANGQGARWDAWTGAVIDLGEAAQPRTPWLEFLGRWGPDGVKVGPLDIGLSPTGPLAKWSWGNNGQGTPWREHLADREGQLLAD
jgi:Vacuolar protein sorting-associated protein 62